MRTDVGKQGELALLRSAGDRKPQLHHPEGTLSHLVFVSQGVLRDLSKAPAAGAAGQGDTDTRPVEFEPPTMSAGGGSHTEELQAHGQHQQHDHEGSLVREMASSHQVSSQSLCAPQVDHNTTLLQLGAWKCSLGVFASISILVLRFPATKRGRTR